MAEKEYIEREAALLSLTPIVKRASERNRNIRSAVNQCVDAINFVPAADVRPVVICSDCKWWTKQKASLQGRCELLQMYPTGTWFCASGKREES